MPMGTRIRLRSVVAALLLAAASSSLVACDPPPAEDLALGPVAAERFAVERSSTDRGPVSSDGAVVIRFTRDVDPRSVGSRSVRVTRSDGRRPLRVRAWAAGRELRVAPLPGREFPVDETLRLHLDGSPSPRSIRSKSGDSLDRAFDATFRASAVRGDLVGPRLESAHPRDGATDVPAGATVELRFDEPVAPGSVSSGDAVTLRVEGRVVPARLALSGDGATVVVHPASPLPPDRRVDLELHDGLLDAAGNPLDGGSARFVTFHTRRTSLHELAEDFVDSARADTHATSCGWDDPETPGVLVGRSDAVLVASGTGEPLLRLAESASLHFQLLLPGADVPDGLASAFRLEFSDAPAGARVLAAVVEAGPTSLDAPEPSFLANRGSAELRPVARVVDPIDVESAVPSGGRAFVDVVFDEPLRLEAGRSVLLDVRIELTAGVRVAAYPDAALHALIEGHGGVAPAASLLVAPATPQARSLWYDTGTPIPGWRTGVVVRSDSDPGVRVAAEYQSAPAGRDGAPDVTRASPWEPDLERLPAYRFIRFRLRFDGAPESGNAARIDRIVMPYER
jgi:Bacterial Ig-like domain